MTKMAYYVIFEECMHPCMISSFPQSLATEVLCYVCLLLEKYFVWVLQTGFHIEVKVIK